MDLKRIQKLTDQVFPKVVEMRRHLHRHPELSYREFKTTEYIIEKLKELDIPVDRPQETGCIGVLEGGAGAGDSDRVVALRADIDALPIMEQGDHKKDFLSKNEGVAHCCGHDGHAANLLGTADVLSRVKDRIEGTILLVFQPGEEQLPGGARLLCETGYLQEKEVDVIYGLHSDPTREPGRIAISKGPLMARPDEFRIELIGQGGHAASPQKTIDPIVLGAEVVTRLQTIVSRNVDPVEPAVVTVGKIEGGTTHNVIPEKVEIIGTVRTFSEETAYFIRDRIEAIAKGVAESAGAEYVFEFDEGYPAVVNTEWAAEAVINTASELEGEQNISELTHPLMAGEDFAFYQQHFPGAFFFLGSGREETGSTYSWHHPRYNIDEECFKTGVSLMASMALQPVSRT